MLAVFGSAEPQSLATNLIYIAAIILSVYIFIKFCGWAKGFQLSGSAKKAIFILTGLGLVVFNVLYAIGNLGVKDGNWNGAFIALAVSIVWVFIFAFALMSESKPE